MPSISVIVPVYQAEKFLKKCVESVVKQTFSDWELLLIDDGCTDASPEICDACAAEDDRIRVFHKKKNGGVSAARNLGLNEAKGDYIAFLDVDDRFEFRARETLWCPQKHKHKCRCPPQNLLSPVPFAGVAFPPAPEKRRDSQSHLRHSMPETRS